MSISNSDKINIINEYVNENFYNVLVDLVKKKSLSPEELVTIKKNIDRNKKDESYVSSINTDSEDEILDFLTNGGLEYNKGSKKMFSAINLSFKEYFKSTAHGLEESNKFSNGTITTIFESISHDFRNSETEVLFLTGNGKGFYDYLSRYFSEEKIEELDRICDANQPMHKTRYDNLVKEYNIIRQKENLDEIRTLNDQEKEEYLSKFSDLLADYEKNKNDEIIEEIEEEPTRAIVTKLEELRTLRETIARVKREEDDYITEEPLKKSL